MNVKKLALLIIAVCAANSMHAYRYTLKNYSPKPIKIRLKGMTLSCNWEGSVPGADTNFNPGIAHAQIGNPEGIKKLGCWISTLNYIEAIDPQTGTVLDHHPSGAGGDQTYIWDGNEIASPGGPRSSIHLHNTTPWTSDWFIYTSQTPCCFGNKPCKVTLQPGESKKFKFSEQTGHGICIAPCMTKLQVVSHQNEQDVLITLDQQKQAAQIAGKDMAITAGTAVGAAGLGATTGPAAIVAVPLFFTLTMLGGSIAAGSKAITLQCYSSQYTLLKIDQEPGVAVGVE